MVTPLHDRELIDGQKVVSLRLFEVDQPDLLITDRAVVLLILDVDPVYQGVMGAMVAVDEEDRVI